MYQLVAPRLGVFWCAARHWLQQARKTCQILLAENARPYWKNRELRDANELLKAASALSTVRARPSTLEIIAFIDEYCDRFSVEFMCATLNSQLQETS